MSDPMDAADEAHQAVADVLGDPEPPEWLNPTPVTEEAMP